MPYLFHPDFSHLCLEFFDKYNQINLVVRFFKRLFFIIPFLAGLLLSLLVFALLLATLLDYRPPEKKTAVVIQPAGKNTINKKELALLSWNIGYAGLGKEMDFFYDGGHQVRPSRQLHDAYLNAILEFLNYKTNMDFILLQEVDEKSRRSYRTDQLEKIAETLPGHCFSFATNYDVPFVPAPPDNPMGKVKSGLMTMSLVNPESSERVSFPGNYTWPISLFMLDRCFLVQRVKTGFGKDLILVNTHNSAFDDGQLRQQQMEVLRTFAVQEFEIGNYVIVGGDWNQNPPDYKPEKITNGDYAVKNDLGNIPVNFMPEGWHWAFDETTPTNRFVVSDYEKHKTPTTIIDYFLVSPNVEVISVSTTDLGFAYSDHNPVSLKVTLND